MSKIGWLFHSGDPGLLDDLAPADDLARHECFELMRRRRGLRQRPVPGQGIDERRVGHALADGAGELVDDRLRDVAGGRYRVPGRGVVAGHPDLGERWYVG